MNKIIEFVKDTKRSIFNNSSKHNLYQNNILELKNRHQFEEQNNNEAYTIENRFMPVAPSKKSPKRYKVN